MEKEYKILALSDLHIGELVKPDDVDGGEGYSIEIAGQRMRTVIKQVKGSKKQDLVVLFLGDLIHGDLAHQDFSETKEVGLIVQAISAKKIIVEALTKLSRKFRNVYVYNAVGNHGRQPNKLRPPNTDIGDNWDWYIIEQVSDHFKASKINNVKITNSKAPFNTLELGNNTIFYTHGDRTLKGTSYSNALSALGKATSLSSKYINFLFCGHYHHHICVQAGTDQYLIMAPCLVGDDPYARNNLMLASKPAQLLVTIKDKKLLDTKVLHAS